MKNRRRIQPIALLALAGLSALSCAKFSGTEQVISQDGGCLVTLSVGEPQTKSAPYYYNTWGDEKQISSLQITIYDDSAGYNSRSSWPVVYSTKQTYSSTVTSASFSTRLSVGSYTAVVIANSDANFAGANYTYFENNFEDNHSLSDDEDYETKGFQAYTTADITVKDGDTSKDLSMTLTRLVGRVILYRICNYTGQTITVNRAWLSNVVTEYNFYGSNGWGNRMGRSSTSSQSSIIDGSTYTADCPTCTYWNGYGGVSIANNSKYTSVMYYGFYALPNSSSVDPDGWSSWSDSKGQKTTLVIDATVNGTQCYYPVVLDRIKRNCTYTVTVNLYDIGSPDPNDPDGKIVTDVSFDAEITVNEWDDGVEYDYPY